MKTKKTRRSLLWGVLLAGFAGPLTLATHPVRAEGITSSAIAAATGDGAVKPYFWSEIAHAFAESLIGNYISPPYNVGVDNNMLPAARATVGISEPALRAIPARALD